MTREFSPAWWLRGSHMQTIWRSLLGSRDLVAYRRESITTPDGDELLLDHVDPPAAGAPHVILLHGLEGSSYSSYIQGLAFQASQLGWGVTALNFRSCGRDPVHRHRSIPNRRRRLYHSGETTDFDFVVRLLRERLGDAPLAAFGASLGGNVLLKWLGEHPDERLLTAAAALSVPFDLATSDSHLRTPMGRLYVARFVRTLRGKLDHLVHLFPDILEEIDPRRVAAARTFREFDDAATAPLHGFADAADYYRRSSSLGFVDRITTPTLAVSAEDDPFLPGAVLREVEARRSPAVDLVVTPTGGHVGFVSGRLPWKSVYWSEELIVDWLATRLGGLE